jgi:hypothetical protein
VRIAITVKVSRLHSAKRTIHIHRQFSKLSLEIQGDSKPHGR